MFGILVQSIEMRRAIIKIQAFDEAEDKPAIVAELIGVLKLIIFFDNIYLPSGEVKQEYADL